MTQAASRKIAWVTGGYSGIGLAIAETLGEMGCDLILSARNQQALEEARERLSATGIAVDIVRADVADREEVNRACRAMLDKHGRIDILVNNAGFNSQKRTWDELIPEEFDAVIAANLTGTFNMIHALLPGMRARKDGLIINISSVAGRQVRPEGGVAYTIAKHGVHIMSQLLLESELKHGIRTCVVAPGFVDTPAHAWRPQELRDMMMQPEDVARAVRFAVETPPRAAILEIAVWPGTH
jgi:NADP-dependent 3-hydroxy acid dehydrogenase YdfG